MVSKRRTLRRSAKALGLALVALMAFSAIASASATTAPRWSVKGSYLAAGATKSFTATNTTEVRLGNASRNLVLTAEPGACTETGEIEGSSEGTSGTKKNVTLTCNNVKTIISGVDRTTLCPVNSVGAEARTIKTNTLKSTLVWLNQAPGGAAGDLLAPASGTNLAAIEIKNAICPLATGATPLNLTNGLIDAILPVEEEAETGTLFFPESPILTSWNNGSPSRGEVTTTQLKLGGSVATFKGNFAISLNPKEKFGVSPVASEKSGEAPRWKVDGTYLHNGQTEPFSAVSSGAMSLAGGWTLSLPECSETGQLLGSKAGVAGGVTNVKLTCKGVKIASSTCEFRSPGQSWGTLVSGSLSGTLVWGKGFEQANLSTTGPGSEIWFEVQTQNCFLGPFSIGGTAIGGTPGQLESLTQPVAFSQSGSKMGFAGSPATLTGTLNTSLVYGKSFGVFPG